MADVEVARLVAKLEADVRDFDRDLRKAERRLDSFGKETKQVDNHAARTGGAISELGSTFGKLGVVVGGMAAATGFARFAQDSLRASSDLNESINALNVVYKENAEGVLAIGENAAESFGMSQSAFNQFAVRFSAFAKNIAGEGGDVVATVEEISQRVADFASVHNLSLEEAAQVAQSTLAGETEVFRRFGGDVSAAAVNAKALELGLAGVGNELTEQEKQLVRYQLFMEQTADTANDFANTSEELANKQRTLEAKLEDTKAAIGEKLRAPMARLLGVAEDLVPVVGSLADVFAVAVTTAEPFIDLLETVSNWFDSGSDSATDQANSVSFLQRAFQSFMDAINPLGGIYRRIKDAVTDTSTSQRDIVAAFGESREPISQYRQGVEGLTEAFGTARGQFHNFGGVVGEVADDVADADFHNPSLIELREEAERVETAARNARIRILELADPFFAAAQATERLGGAQDNYADALAKGDPEQIDRAALALADAKIEAQLASEGLNAMADTRFDTFLGGLQAIGDALELNDQAVIDLLNRLGILDGYRATVFIDSEVDWEEIIPQWVLDIINARPPRTIPSSALPPVGPPGIPALQHGGPAMAGHPYLVGETGPELFIPNTSGQVVPGMGGTYNLNVTVEGNADMNTVQAIQEELLLATLTQWSET